MRRGRALFAALCLVAVPAACGGDDDVVGDDPGTTATDTSTPSTAIVSVPAPPLPTTPPSGDGGAVVSEIFAAAPDDVRSNALGADGWTIDLRPGRELLAEAIRARYGDTVAVTIAGQPWPVTTTATPPACTGLAPIDGDELEDVTATIALDASTVRLGTEMRGTVTVVNGSAQPVQFTSGPEGVVAVVVDDGEPAAFLDGHQLAMAVVHTVEPGTTSEPIPLIAGVASCQPASGTAVQPGRYEVTAQLRLGATQTVTADPVPVAVVVP